MDYKSIGIKFVGALLVSWSIFSFLTDSSYRFFFNMSLFTIENVAWIPLEFPTLETIGLAVGLTLLVAKFNK